MTQSAQTTIPPNYPKALELKALGCDIYIYIYIYIYANLLPRNVDYSNLPHHWSRNSQDPETSLAPSPDT